MDPVLLLLVGGALAAGSVGVYNRVQQARRNRASARTELADIARLAEADAVSFGEELARLDARVADAELDAETRVDYQNALDAYESALRVADRLETIDQVSGVVDALAAGRYSAACVQARVDGAPLPTFSTPCFFDPRHGPAATEVLWTARGRGTRKVPACAQDAERQQRGAELDVTMVRINGLEVPYWAAGGLYQPYENGYAPRTVREATLDIKAAHSLYDSPFDMGGFLN